MAARSPTVAEAAAATRSAVDTVLAAATAAPLATAEERRRDPPPLPPKTTAQEDLTFAGQRRINLIWEHTQAIIALTVVVSSMASGVYITFSGSQAQIPTIMSVAFGTVVGFYFARSNHTAIGGVGPQPKEGKYRGR